MTTYPVVLFDLDHTLFDSDASEAEAYVAALSNAGVDDPHLHFGDYARINRALWAELERGTVSLEEVRVRRFGDLAAAKGLRFDSAVVADEYSRLLGECGGLLPGALDALAELSDVVELGLVTNGVSSTQRARLERTGIAGYFSSIVVSGEFGAAKPGTAIFDEALRHLGDPDRDGVLMVGDSLSSDIAGAEASGLSSCWYNPRGASSDNPVRIDHEIESLREVFAIAIG